MNRIILLLSVLLFSALVASASPADTTTPWGALYTRASFPGGPDSLSRYLGMHLVYPAAARENDIYGRVVIRFTVQPDGARTDLTIIRGIGGGCDEEAIKCIKRMPPWLPATYPGRPFMSEVYLPIYFHLADRH